VLIVIYDALSARNMSLYGYGRPTTPNIDRLAERAVVFHNHLAPAPWTGSSTASLLTGTLPWTHRAFSFQQGVEPGSAEQNLFHAFPAHYRLAYSHNPFVYPMLKQFRASLDEYIPIEALYRSYDHLSTSLFEDDADLFSLAWRRTTKQGLNGGYSYSLLLPEFLRRQRSIRLARVQPSFPEGLPTMRGDDAFVLEEATDFLAARVRQVRRPFLGYFHFLPPHDPYRPRLGFHDAFLGDGFRTPQKPLHAFADIEGRAGEYIFINGLPVALPPAGPARAPAGTMTEARLEDLRQRYDEFVLEADSEFGRLFRGLDESGILEDTWLVLTSDHGELFERGIWGHTQRTLFQPVVHIPLLFFEPGRSDRRDVYEPTSTIDLLPTLIEVAGGEPASWAEGAVLPPFAAAPPRPDRSLYSMWTAENRRDRALQRGTVAVTRGPHKIVWYGAYPSLDGKERVEVFDLEADPEESRDLAAAQPTWGADLLDELKTKLQEVNRPYL